MHIIKLTPLTYIDFEEIEQTISLLSIESYLDDAIQRSFICFEEDSIDNSITLISNDNILAIHKALGNIDLITPLLNFDLDQYGIKIAAYTSKYWEDVRLFSHTSGFHYANDVYNTAVIEQTIYKHIRDQFYKKDMIVSACEDNNAAQVIELIEKSSFNQKDIELIVQQFPFTMTFLNPIILNEQLRRELQSTESSSFHKNKI